MRRALVLTLWLPCVFAGAAHAQDWREFRAARQQAPVHAMDVEVFYGAGELSIAPAPPSFLYDATLRYDATRFRPVRRWSTDSGRGVLRIALEGSGRETDDDRIRIDLDGGPDIHLSLDDLKRIGDSRSRLELALHPDVPTDLDVAVGAAASRLELGGTTLTSLSVRTGASDTRIAFSEPNRTRAREITLRAGAAEFRVDELGNARFDHLEFRGSVGDVTLDFRGDWNGNASADVRMGVGSLRLVIPEHIGVRIERRTLLAAVDAGGLSEVEGALQSDNWDAAAYRLTVNLHTTLGAVEIDRVR